MGTENRLKRFFEIMPGALSWGIIAFFVVIAFINPVACAVMIIIFDFYWIIRTVYLTTLLVMAYRALHKEKFRNWLGECEAMEPEKKWRDIYHLVIFPVYKETTDTLVHSLEALRMSDYPKDKLIVVMAYEERNPLSHKNAEFLEREFKDEFFVFLSTFHPDGLPGEKRTKGANATWAAKRAKEFLDKGGIGYESVVVSCFDSDTCVDPEYFACLTYHFLTNAEPHKASYQPMPVYNNNIWQAPSFARIVETSASFCQLIESVRLEKFVTFSSHSMSFKTLVDIDYWPVDMISDDSVIYWKAFIHFDGDYRVVPLYITVSMDAAYSSSFLKTILMQYKQKRRWAWGVENFPFIALGFIKNKRIPLFIRLKRSFNLLESHVTWAVWAIILVLIGPLPILLGGAGFNTMAISYNLPKITGLLFNFTIITSLTWIILSRTILPPRPKEVSWKKNIVMVMEWAIIPLVILVVGSSPALDAQTRMMLAKYMEFNPTQKRGRMV